MLFSKPMLITKAVACIALCASSVPAMAGPACVGGAQGCVLPLPEPVVVQPVQQTVAPVMIEEPTGGLGIIPILAGLAALGLLAYLLLDEDEDEDVILPPVSP